MKKRVQSCLACSLLLIFFLSGAVQASPEYFGFTSPALSQIPDYHDGEAAIVYSLGWNGRPVTGVWLAENTLAGDGAEQMTLLSKEYLQKPAAPGVPLPVVPGEDTVGTGMTALFRDAATGEEIPATIIVRGDVTGGGKINLTQLVAMSKMLTGSADYAYYQITAADWTGTGKVNLTDLVIESSLFSASSAPLLRERDFVLKNCFDAQVREYDGNLLALMRQKGLWSYYFWSDSENGGSAASVLTTARDIRLGDPLRDIQAAYGFGYRERFDPEGVYFLQNFAHDEAARQFLIENAVWWLDYFSEDGALCIEFALDANERAIFVDFLDLTDTGPESRAGRAPHASASLLTLED